MKADLRRVLGFALRFVPIFLVLLGIYLKALPWYRPIPEGVANSIMELQSPPTRIESSTQRGWRAYVRDPHDQRVLTEWEPFVVHLLFLNMVLLPALVLATPAPIRDRLRLAAWAIPLLVMVQALSLVGLVRGQLCLAGSPGSFLCLWLLRLVYASGQLSAAVLWSILTWRFWLAENRPESDGA